MAGRGNRGPTQNEINTALLTALAGITEHIQGMGRGNGNHHHEPPPFDLAKAAGNISRSRLNSYAGKVDPEALDLWFRQVEKQFEINEVPDNRKVTIAAHHLEGEADRWWRMVGPNEMLTPGFGWNHFMTLMENRFIPAELKHRKMEEFMSFRQGALSVQEYTDKFNKLAHYATPLLPNETQKAFFYRNGLAAEVAHSVPRAADTVSEIYNTALWGERSLEKVKKERAWSASKRPFRSISPTPPAKRSQPNGGSGFEKPFAPPKFEERKEVSCIRCHKPIHPDRNCNGSLITCYFCKETGHKSPDCPKKNRPVATADATVVAPRPKGRIFLLSRAAAEANPSIITGTFLLLVFLPLRVRKILRFLLPFRVTQVSGTKLSFSGGGCNTRYFRNSFFYSNKFPFTI